MNINVIKDNISSFVLVLLLLGGTLGSAFVYVFLEYKELQKEKINFQEAKQKIELELVKAKHNLELQRKNFEIQKTKYNSNTELTKSNLIDNANLKAMKCEETLQRYKYQSNTLLTTKDIDIQNLQNKVDEQKNQMNNLYASLEKSKEKNLLLEEYIKKLNAAEKISQLISEYSKKYAAISKDDYEKYSDYMEASRQFEAIDGLIKVHHLEKEYATFVRLMNQKLYVYKK